MLRRLKKRTDALVGSLVTYLLRYDKPREVIRKTAVGTSTKATAGVSAARRSTSLEVDGNSDDGAIPEAEANNG